MKVNPYGILGQKAPELNVDYFIDDEGHSIAPIRLKELGDNVKILFCFQSGCPSCHHKGFPMLQQLVKTFDEQLADGELSIIAIQTAFEARTVNSVDTLVEMQHKYKIKLPFAHDDAYPRPHTMTDYRTGGTPWYIIIDKNNNVIFNDFHLDESIHFDLIRQAIAGENEVPEAFVHEVVDNEEKQRYFIKLDKDNDAVVTYRKEGGVLYLDHTEVPVALRGKGYGAVMMEAVLEKIESQAYKIKPICSYARHHATRYQRWAHLLA